MMKNIKSRMFVLFASIVIAACSDGNNAINGDEPEGDFPKIQIALDVANNEVSAAASGLFLKIQTSGTWTISVTESWCTFQRVSGTGNASVMGTVASNSAQARSAIITVKVGEESQSITLRQKAKEDGGGDGGEESEFENAGRIEIPALKGGDMNPAYSHYTTFDGKKTITYSMEYDCAKKHTRWIAFTFYDKTSSGNAGRNEDWAADSHISAQYRTDASDYKAPYNRGHLCASGDRQYSKDANRQTFFYSNMSPQLVNFNGGIWATIENKVQSWGNNSTLRDTLYVVKGGTIRDDQIIGYNGPHRTAVPKYYYMAILARKNNNYQAIGVFLEHKIYSDNKSILPHIVSIDELEEKTGIDFFHNLAKDEETKVETTYNKNYWGL